eukprot:3237561-Rhodomonas_salina.2
MAEHLKVHERPFERSSGLDRNRSLSLSLALGFWLGFAGDRPVSVTVCLPAVKHSVSAPAVKFFCARLSSLLPSARRFSHPSSLLLLLLAQPPAAPQPPASHPSVRG